MLGVCHMASCWNPTHSPWCQWLFGWAVMTSIAYNLSEQYGWKIKIVLVAWAQDLLRNVETPTITVGWQSQRVCTMQYALEFKNFYRSFTWWYWQRDMAMMRWRQYLWTLLLSWRDSNQDLFLRPFYGISSNYDYATGRWRNISFF